VGLEVPDRLKEAKEPLLEEVSPPARKYEEAFSLTNGKYRRISWLRARLSPCLARATRKRSSTLTSALSSWEVLATSSSFHRSPAAAGGRFSRAPWRAPPLAPR
jgi:hypothetical protein